MSKPPTSNKRPIPGKWTMKEPYTKARFLSVQTRAALDLFRPFTLAAPFIVSMSIMVASLVFNFENFGTEIPEKWYFTVAQAGLTIAIVNAASNSLNQATDVEADRISKPYRPIPRGIIKRDGAQSLAYILYLFALLRAVTINAWFGFFVFLIMIFTVTYSLPPRMKKYLFINQVWVAIPRGFFGILASWCVFGSEHLFDTPTPWVIGGLATVFLIGGMATKDITDAEADKATGVRTMINTFGTRKTAYVSFPFMFFSFAFIPIFINDGALKPYLHPLTLFAALGILIFYLMYREMESKTLENIQAWALMYVTYIFFALCFAVLTIFNKVLPF
ncbi:MAG TPA: 4-hydroxybenzoate polyprenyltransferase [Bacteroidetes bacterium]|nr:4-hydroxybenzoate polyprenyltransferase [Bacteroidota bacterium]